MTVTRSNDDVGRGDSLPPAILLGADLVHTASIGRSLARTGVQVYLLGRPRSIPALSRYSHHLPTERGQAGWERYLLGRESDHLRGAVVLACNDDAVELLIEHGEELERKFVLDVSNRDAQRCLLNKLTTYQKAAEAGVPTPLFWRAGSLDQLHAQREEYVYPLLVKPLYSHKFKAVAPGKYLRVTDFDELRTAYEDARRQKVDVLLLEEIPGPDDLLCSYYTYIDESGAPQFDFTKRIIRRYPEHEGYGCLHVTDWNPEVRELGLRLFEHAGLLGVANVEFKRDLRDGKLKIIECNARFTAANQLLIASGYDLGLFVYNRLVGRPQPELRAMNYKKGLHYWYPIDDFRAFLELRREGRLTLPGWLKSVLHYPQVLPYFDLSDPVPTVLLVTRKVRSVAAPRARVRALLARLRGGELGTLEGSGGEWGDESLGGS